MPDIDEHLEKMIKSSLFLDSKRKKRLFSVFEGMLEGEKKKLLEVLEAEASIVRKTLEKYISKKGQNALDKLYEIFASGKREVIKSKEMTTKKVEEAEMEKLIQELEDM